MSEKNDVEPPPYHDWTVVPDTALLPPPPTISYHASPIANASPDDADRAHAWTDANPLWPASELSSSGVQALSIGFASLIKPTELLGTVEPEARRAGIWNVQTRKKCGDCCLLSNVPLFAARHSMVGGRDCTAYYEIKLREMGTDAGVALGFIAPPYPTWRLPGWERASLGVHGDDGRRFINDTYGGRDFTSPFKQGDVIGIGMVFKAPQEPPQYAAKEGVVSRYKVEVFMTRNGKKEGSWDLHEEVDSGDDRPGGVTGLEGEHDLHAAIGVYGAVDFSVVFGRHNWVYQAKN